MRASPQAASSLSPAPSAMLAPAVKSITPLALLAAVYLLFAGHNNPGGGFAAALVVGAVLSLRSLADLSYPRIASPLIAAGMIAVTLVAATPLLFGDLLLDQAVWKADVPILGTVKSGSALPFDIGVTAIVVGLVIAVLERFDDLPASPLDSSTGPSAQDPE